MNVLYVWPNSNFKMSGVNSPTISHIKLASSIRPNIDYLHVAEYADIFCVSATRQEVEHLLLPAIRSDDHKLKITAVLQDKEIPGLPFLIDRYAKCIQLIDSMPWRTYNGVCQTRLPFVRLKETKVATLAGLVGVNIQALRATQPLARAASSLLKPSLVD